MDWALRYKRTMRFILVLAEVLGWMSVARADEPARPKVLGISHIALYVHDMENARAFYHGYLGFDEPFHLDNANGTLHLTWMKINDRQTIEIFPEKQVGSLRVYHMAIETNDAEAMRVYLAGKKVRVPDKTGKGKIGNSNYFVTDPDGHIVEIVTYEPDGWTVREKGKFLPAARISDHLAYLIVPVSTFEKAEAFYKGILGFDEVARSDNRLKLKVPDGGDYLEFVKYADVSRAEQQNREQHIGLEVKDLGKAMEILNGRVLPKECRAPSGEETGADGRKRIALYDPDGTHVELVEAK
jgi:catechol 2,3-dioxygenase-like lactoylglutathione lyase family enzyme